jgi:hypothetical protein
MQIGPWANDGPILYPALVSATRVVGQSPATKYHFRNVGVMQQLSLAATGLS